MNGFFADCPVWHTASFVHVAALGIFHLSMPTIINMAVGMNHTGSAGLNQITNTILFR
jgi:hypothetical protein